MKILILALSLILATKGFCDWPVKTLSALAIATDPKAALAPYLEGFIELHLTASDYRGITLTFDPKKDEFICLVPVAYYEVSSWLSGSWEDNEKDGWSPRPSNGLENFHSDLGSLVGILDQASIKSRRISIVRTDRKTKDVRAVWNKLKFSISSKNLPTMFDFLREFYGDYRPDTKVDIYAEKKVEQVADGKTPEAPQSPH